MSNHDRMQWAGLIALLCAVAGSAAATPLTYSVVAAESNLLVRDRVTATIDVNPDFTETAGGAGQFPFTETLQGASNTMPSPLSHVIADVGLPGGFDDGANGITFSELVIHSFSAPGTIGGGTAVPIPLAITGSPVLFVTASASVTSLQITLNTPFSSTLTPSVNPGEWLWAGVADVTISGNLNPQLLLPAQVALAPGATPFSQVVSLPLLGTFSAVPGGGTRINVGIPSDALHDQDLSLPPISESVDLLDLGLVTASLDMNSLILADISSSIVYQNATPIPEPGTALLVGLGVIGLALRRRR